MRLSNGGSERGRWSRSLALIGLLTLGTACGGGSDGAIIGRAADAPAAAEAQQPVETSQFTNVPGPAVRPEQLLREGARSLPQPPAPDLGIGRPRVPPSTVSLESLHEQGRTHVLR